MSRIGVYRDYFGKRELVGYFDGAARDAKFWYAPEYLSRVEPRGEQGISESMPLDMAPYEPHEYAPFFQGLLPEGEVLTNLVQRYQTPGNDFLSFLERLGCESIGALTFVSESADVESFSPSYEALDADDVGVFRRDGIRAATEMTDDLRLSLAGAQAKVAWFLSAGTDASSASLGEWQLPRGTAPSSHIIKLSRPGQEDLALNELVCMRVAGELGFAVPEVALIPDIPGALAVKRYDRISIPGVDGLVRLHQEDFCQARGLPPYLKYADAAEGVSYVELIGKLVESVSSSPAEDKLELGCRLLFHYLIGNADNHLKNYAFLYSPDWKSRRLAPLYDVTCIPLTGYSTKMAFALGKHRQLAEITAEDLALMAKELGVSVGVLRERAATMVSAFDCISSEMFRPDDLNRMAALVLENARPRREVLEEFAQDMRNR